MDQKSSCPWGAPITPVAWGSPLPSEDSQNNSQQSSPPLNSGDVRIHGGLQRSNDSQRTPNTPSLRGQQRSRPYTPRSYSNRMGFDNNSPQSSPRHFQPRSRFQSSPRFSTPNGQFQPRYTDSPVSHFKPRSDFSSSPQQRFSSNQKSFSPRHSRPSNFNNVDMSQYVHPSMLEDPWRNLPPVPLLQQY